MDLFYNEYREDFKRKREEPPKTTLLVMVRDEDESLSRLCFLPSSEIPLEMKTGFQMASKLDCCCYLIASRNADDKHFAHQLVMQDCFGVLDSESVDYAKHVTAYENCFHKKFVPGFYQDLFERNCVDSECTLNPPRLVVEVMRVWGVGKLRPQHWCDSLKQTINS
jgi:hypothetical protein